MSVIDRLKHEKLQSIGKFHKVVVFFCLFTIIHYMNSQSDQNFKEQLQSCCDQRQRVQLFDRLVFNKRYALAREVLDLIQDSDNRQALNIKLKFCTNQPIPYENIISLKKTIKHPFFKQAQTFRYIVKECSAQVLKVQWNNFRKSAREGYFQTCGMPVYLASSQWIKTFHHYLQTNRDYPPPIHNLQLLDFSKNSLEQEYTSLLPSLIHDKNRTAFQFLSKQEWEFVKKYFGGFQVKRTLVMTDKLTYQVQLKLQNIPVIIGGSQKVFMASKNQLFSDLIKQLRKAYSKPTMDIFRVVGDKQKVLALKPNSPLLKDLLQPVDLYKGLFQFQNIVIYCDDLNCISINNKCNYCGQSQMLRRCQCEAVYFCGSKCQKLDKKHLALCQQQFKKRKTASQLINFEIPQKKFIKVGLVNLGNTCYLNSALQALGRVQPLANFFMGKQVSKCINFSNPLGYSQIAIEYAKLIRRMWSTSDKYINPGSFVQTIRKLSNQFKAYRQEDANQLLSFLLQALHQDLNQIKVKPYIQNPDVKCSDSELSQLYWQIYQKRNKSFISDLCAGQFITKISCPVCKNISVTFDPFMIVPVPLTRPQIKVYVVSGSPQHIVLYRVPIKSGMKGKDVQNQLSAHFKENGINRPAHYSFYFFQQSTFQIRSLEGEKINKSCSILCMGGNVSVQIKLRTSTDKKITFQRFYRFELTERAVDVYQKLALTFNRSVVNISKYDNYFELILNGQKKSNNKNSFFTGKPPFKITLVFIPEVRSHHLQLNHVSESVGKSQFELQDCLQKLGQSQNLDKDNQWYCNKCKCHRSALVSQRIFRSPKILILQLKRFKKSAGFYTKANSLVKFPINRLDLSPFLPQGSQKIYRLISTIQHSGNLSNGHYTSCVQSEGNWLLMNDQSARFLKSQKDVENERAYVLIYELLENNV